MEKIEYTERIRELADILAKKLVIRKAKNRWAAAHQVILDALAIDYSTSMKLADDDMLARIRNLQKEETELENNEAGVKKELGERLTELFKDRIVRINDSLFAVFDSVTFDKADKDVAHFHGKAFDTYYREATKDFNTYSDVTKQIPSPLRRLSDGEHYELTFPDMHFVTWDDLEPEFAIVDHTGSFRDTVMELIGISK